MTIDYERFERIGARCKEIAEDTSLPPILAIVYDEVVKGPLEAFLTASKAVDTARSAFAKENGEALAALDEVDGPYRVARSSVLAVLPETVLPETLKSLPTDTDKVNAIERLTDVIDDHVGKPWADTLLAGPFGTLGPKVVKEITEAVAANLALSKAMRERAAAFGPAHEVYMRFKRVVRDALGPGSKQYRRIHLRASPGKKEEGGDD